MRLMTRASLMLLGLFLAGWFLRPAMASPVTEPVATAAAPKFLNSPVFGPPFLEANTVFQGQQAVLGFEIGCNQNLVSPLIHDFSVNDNVVSLTVNVTITLQCFPTGIFRHSFGADLSPGAYEVRLFARYGNLIVPKGSVPLQVLAAEPVPTLQSFALLLLITFLTLTGLWVLRMRF